MNNIYNYLHFFNNDIISLNGLKEVSIPLNCRNNNSHFINSLHFNEPRRASCVWDIFTRIVTHALSTWEHKSDKLLLEDIMESLTKSTPLVPTDIEFILDTANNILSIQYAFLVQDLLKSLFCKIFQLYFNMINFQSAGFSLIVKEDIHYSQILEKDKLTIACYISNNVQRQHNTICELNNYWDNGNSNDLLLIKPYLGILEYIIKSQWLMNDDSFIANITSENSYSLLILDSIELFPLIKHYLGGI